MSYCFSRLAGLAVISALAGCAATPTPLASLVRVVKVKYKEPLSDKQQREFLSDITTQIVPLPTVRGLYLGRPVQLSKREWVTATVDDYDMAFVILFLDDRGLRDYLDHPATGAFTRSGCLSSTCT
jgi:hypothetical protein